MSRLRLSGELMHTTRLVSGSHSFVCGLAEDRVLHSPGWPQTRSVGEDGTELLIPLLPISSAGVTAIRHYTWLAYVLNFLKARG